MIQNQQEGLVLIQIQLLMEEEQIVTLLLLEGLDHHHQEVYFCIKITLRDIFVITLINIIIQYIIYFLKKVANERGKIWCVVMLCREGNISRWGGDRRSTSTSSSTRRGSIIRWCFGGRATTTSVPTIWVSLLCSFTVVI